MLPGTAASRWRLRLPRSCAGAEPFNFEIEERGRERRKLRADRRAAAGGAELDPAGSSLFEALRAWRLEEARRQQLPPYVIFPQLDFDRDRRPPPDLVVDTCRDSGTGPQQDGTLRRRGHCAGKRECNAATPGYGRHFGRRRRRTGEQTSGLIRFRRAALLQSEMIHGVFRNCCLGGETMPARFGIWCCGPGAAALVVVGLLFGGVSSGAEERQFFRIGAAATSGTFFEIGGLIASAISKPTGAPPLCERGAAAVCRVWSQ